MGSPIKPFSKPSWLQDGAGDIMPVERFLQLTGTAVTSLTDDPTNDRTVADLTAGGGGGGLALGTLFGDYIQGSQQNLALNGTTQKIVNDGGPVAWLDATGHILEEGLYANGLLLSKSGPASAGLFVVPQGAFYEMGGLVSVDVMQNMNAPQGFLEIGAVDASVLPYNSAISLFMPTDAGAFIACSPFIARIAF